MRSNSIFIAGNELKPGKETVINLEIAKLHNRNPIDVPVIVQRSKIAGPTVLLTAGIHGNELNGVEIVRQIIRKGINKPKRGMIICIPIVNVFGFINLKREFPDGRDLNRMFPGSAKGSLAAQFAYQLMQHIIPVTDYCIDFHTGGASRFNFPQLRIDKLDIEELELARVFGTKFIIQSPTRDKSFRATVKKLNKKVLLFEGGKSLEIDSSVVNDGISGTIAFLKHLEMLDKDRFEFGVKRWDKPLVINKTKWIRARHSGMFRSISLPGDWVVKGQNIGIISGPYGDFEKYTRASGDGYLIGINQAPVVNKGDALFHISLNTKL